MGPEGQTDASRQSGLQQSVLLDICRVVVEGNFDWQRESKMPALLIGEPHPPANRWQRFLVALVAAQQATAHRPLKGVQKDGDEPLNNVKVRVDQCFVCEKV